MTTYTREEEQALRKVVENHWLRGSYSAETGPARPHTYEMRQAELEYNIRLHMQAGHSASDLLATESNIIFFNHKAHGRKAA